MKKIDRYIVLHSEEECLREWETLVDPRFIEKKNDMSHFFQGRHVNIEITMLNQVGDESEALREKPTRSASKQVEK